MKKISWGYILAGTNAGAVNGLFGAAGGMVLVPLLGVFIIAHIGRAYAEEDVGDAFERLEEAPGLIFEFSANANGAVMEKMIRSVGPKRIIHGSDSPILRMRMGRVVENGSYVNLVRKGQYAGISLDPHMREIEGEAADALTYFTYYQIDAFIKAGLRCGLTHADFADVFYNNAAEILGLK